MRHDERIAVASERLAVGTSIARVQAEDGERAQRNGVPAGAALDASKRLERMAKRLWARIS